MSTRKYGWIRQLPDQRDKEYAYKIPEYTIMPTTVDMRPLCPPVFDQGNLGSCTSNSAIAMLWFLAHRQGENPVVGSRLFHYYNERLIKSQDTGSTIRQSVKMLVKYGAPAETEWPYDITQFKKKPDPKCYADGALHLAKVYRPVSQDLVTMKSCLSDGYPILIGFTVYSSFESAAVAKTGLMPMPSHSENVLGGHAVLVVGYDDNKQCFTVRNSWGSAWGDAGYFYMPYAYATDPHLASDFWTITTVE